MLSPAAKHLQKADSPARVVRVLDRGRSGVAREERRKAWRLHGARLVTNYPELLTDAGEPMDGVLVCAGKNGDDRDIIRDLMEQMAMLRPAADGQPRFVLHLSTVSARFARAAAEFAHSKGVVYANYPLTGGPAGAEAATMLILAGGDRALFDRVLPLLKCLGKPRYFTENAGSGAEAKLIGHYLVFHGLLGICSGAALQGRLMPETGAVEFFDFLNQGAGHTRQWELALRRGLADGVWESGFYCKHACVDAIYAIQLAQDAGQPLVGMLPMYQVALLFALAVQSSQAQHTEFATHAIFRQIAKVKSSTADRLLAEVVDLRDPVKSLHNLIQVLPPSIRECVALEISGPAFFEEAAS